MGVLSFLKNIATKQQGTAETAALPDGFSGDYPAWNDALSYTTGYDAGNILETVKQATLKVKNGEAVYERDSMLFDTLQHHWPMLACMEKIALENNLNLSVLDFGGSLGSNYNYIKKTLPANVNLKWTIVEQEHFVACGKESFENNELRFVYNTEEAVAQNGLPHVVLLSGVLQYLPDPNHFIDVFNKLKAPYILLTRTGYTSAANGFWTVQKVPASLYDASYPAYFFKAGEFDTKLTNYERLYSFNDPFTPNMVVSGKNVYWAGELYKLKNGR